MREIKFRGKRVDNGEWVYGYLVVKAGMPFIFSFGVIDPILVIPETIGQFTGLKDKNGVEIYEGDIIQSIYQKNKLECRFVDWCFRSTCPHLELIDKDNPDDLYDIDIKEWEVIGNIHDKE